MAWPGQKPEDRPEADGKSSRFALPPACPRCELTKSQMNRTIQNYQKAYRKKVEGLKAELTSVRADNQHLKRQVKRLRRKRLTHLPSLLIGAGVSFAVSKLVQLYKQKQQQQQQEGKAQELAVEEQQAAANGSSNLAAASE